MKFLNKSQQFNKIIGSPAKRAMRAGKKEGGLGEGTFARPPFLGGGWVCVAFGDAQVSQNFAQKRFALRPVIATRCNFYNFWGNLIARSPRLRLGSLRKFLYFERSEKQGSCRRQGSYILGLNQADEQNQKRFFYPAGGGSELRSKAQNENFVSDFFFPPKAEYETSFSLFMPKATY